MSKKAQTEIQKILCINLPEKCMPSAVDRKNIRIGHRANN